MITFILNIDWMTTTEFCEAYNVPLPTAREGVNGLLRIDAVKHKLFLDRAKALDRVPFKPKSLIELEKERMVWALETFPEATAVSSLRKCESEIKEIEENIEAGIQDAEEYADAIMCLFDSAGRNGITIEQIVSAFAKKLEKNKSRTWVKNDDNSYSHVKSQAPISEPYPYDNYR
ncbi:dATP/dGTP pyrophosphohydrolase domain-containing protein [Dyadobacter aurulentus]|uniref:dATP/dGTP pyrophosphohydrolase domain-containing protein n=1 Tax=Dyadobacter sp. UC 10 TaxID=2605428 RepID=UPI001788E3EE|nr:dATP/dGTP pyrophosphohydrolase domain-containing protein [Dyadobacter sp. UC 10]